MEQQRRIAAILFADIAGYSALMQADEHRALAIVQKFRHQLDTLVAQNKGKINHYYGDGCLVIFDSTVDAVACAQALQQAYRLAPSVPVRIGIHVGEVVFQAQNAFGDAVNIASRVESMGIPGSVLLSGYVRNQIRNHPEFELRLMGDYEFKNIEDAITVYALAAEGMVVPETTDLKGKLKEAVTEKTIAVLPFTNMSSDPAQEYFSDGLTEELIADLSQLQTLRVISRTSVMGFKNTSKKIKTIGKELGVQYILEGSVRKAGERLRITAQLIDATTDQHLWAEKYKGTLEDIFDLQEEVSRQIVSALDIHLTNKEKRQMAKRPIDIVEAYDLYLKAQNEIRHPSEGSLQKAMELTERALTMIGKNELLLSTKGYIHLTYINLGLKPDQSHADAAKELIDEIFTLHPDSLEGLFLKALYLVHLPDRQEAARLLRQVLERSPNHIDALTWYIITCLEAGQPHAAYPFIKHLLALDPLTAFNYAFLAWYYLTIDDIDKTELYYEKAYQMNPNHPFTGFFLASFLPVANKAERAIELLQKAESFPPQLIIPHLSGFLKYALLGQKQKALALATPQLKEQASWSSNTCYQMARVYALLGEKDEMLHWLYTAMEKGFYNDFHLTNFPAFAPFTDDADFQQVLMAIRSKREHFQA